MYSILATLCLCKVVLAGLPPHGHYQTMATNSLLPPVATDDDGQYHEEFDYRLYGDHQSSDDEQYKEESYDDNLYQDSYDDGQSNEATAFHSVAAPAPMPSHDDDGQYHEETHAYQSYDDGQYKEQTHDDGQQQSNDDGQYHDSVYSAPVPSNDGDDDQYHDAQSFGDDGQYHPQSYDDGQY